MTAAQSPRMVCVVGAPRCGTTSLSTWLRQHPDICFSRVKEPHFFSYSDLTVLPAAEQQRRVEDEYLRRYFPDRARASVLAEGSVSYLYAPERMEPILGLWPDARFVIAVRDPMAMLPSLHLRLRYIGDEIEPSFERAWSLASDRRQGKGVPSTCLDPRWLDYREIASLGKHVERFVARVGRERCFISVFDDLASDPEATYRQLLQFLDLPFRGCPDFAPQRSSRGIRLGMLQRLLMRPPGIARSPLAARALKHKVTTGCNGSSPTSLRWILQARKRILRWNTIERAPAEAVPHHLQVQIREALREDIENLAKLVGRSLDHWLSPRRESDPVFAAVREAEAGPRLAPAGAARLPALRDGPGWPDFQPS